jgi:outer membrane protein assembly factor BamB
VLATPTIAYNSTLGVNLVYAVNDKGVLKAFNAASGALVWKTVVGGSVESTPTVYDGTIYVGNSKGFVSEVDATTGTVDCTFNLPVVPPETVPGRV